MTEWTWEPDARPFAELATFTWHAPSEWTFEPNAHPFWELSPAPEGVPQKDYDAYMDWAEGQPLAEPEPEAS